MQTSFDLYEDFADDVLNQLNICQLQRSRRKLNGLAGVECAQMRPIGQYIWTACRMTATIVWLGLGLTNAPSRIEEVLQVTPRICNDIHPGWVELA